MKKLLAAVVLAGLLTSQANAILMTKDVPVFVANENNPLEWNIIDDLEAGTTTYWVKIEGNYNIELGEAAITMESGGELSIYTTNTDWSTELGIGLTSNSDPYQVDVRDNGEGAQTSHMAVYIGCPRYHPFPCFQYHVNTYNYQCTKAAAASNNVNGVTSYVNKDGETINTTLPNTSFSQYAKSNGTLQWNNPNRGPKLTFGYTMGAARDAEGNITGLRLTVPQTFETPDYTMSGSAMDVSVDAETEGAQQVVLQTDAWLDSDGYYVDLPNMGYGFDLLNLVSYGVSTIDTGETYGIDNDAETYIVITKALRANAVPEPTTATLSLLALAGLAARRRRK